MAQSSVVDPKIKEEERNFSKLFQVILQKIVNMENVPESDIAQAISSLIEGFKRYEFSDMKQWENVCAYLFRYATHGAGLTRDRVLKAVRESEDLASCLRKTDLKIVSLGGGPGNDIIGFCSALFECVEESESKDKRCNLNITVIDRYDEWSVCVSLLKKLVMEGNFGNVSELLRLNNVRMSFFQVNVARSMTDQDYFYFLRTADVILMVKLISGEFMKTNESVDYLIETLKNTMRDEALLLYIDVPILPTITNEFDVLYQSDLGTYRMRTENIYMYNSSDSVTSEAQIAVLRKSSCSPKKKRKQ